MSGVPEHTLAAPHLHQAARVHDPDTVGQIVDDRKIVRDVHKRGAGLRSQIPQQRQNPRLRARIEAGRRLIQDDDQRLTAQRHRDRHALLLAAAQLERVPSKKRRIGWKMHPGDQGTDGGPRLPMRAEHFFHLLADAMARVEPRRRVLRHIGDPRAARESARRGGQRQDILPVHAHRSGRDPRPATGMTEQRQRRTRLPGSRLSHEPKHFAVPHRERDPIDDLDAPGGFDAQPPDVEHGAAHVTRHG